MAYLGHLFCSTAGFLPDVFPLPAGRLELLPHRRAAQLLGVEVVHVEGIEETPVMDATEALEEFETHKFEHKGTDGGAK